MILIITILIFLILLITPVFIPVTIRVDYFPVSFFIRWHIIGIKAVYNQNILETSFLLFSKRIKTKKKILNAPKPEGSSPETDKPKAEKKKPKKSKQKKPFKKIGINEGFEILKSNAAEKILQQFIKLVKRLKNSITIKTFRLDFGVPDVFLQGILSGLTYSIPQNKQVSIEGNFFENNKLELTATLSVFKSLSAVMLLLMFFPYLKTFRIYKKYLK